MKIKKIINLTLMVSIFVACSSQNESSKRYLASSHNKGKLKAIKCSRSYLPVTIVIDFSKVFSDQMIINFEYKDIEDNQNNSVKNKIMSFSKEDFMKHYSSQIESMGAKNINEFSLSTVGPYRKIGYLLNVMNIAEVDNSILELTASDSIRPSSFYWSAERYWGMIENSFDLFFSIRKASFKGNKGIGLSLSDGELIVENKEPLSIENFQLYIDFMYSVAITTGANLDFQLKESINFKGQECDFIY